MVPLTGEEVDETERGALVEAERQGPVGVRGGQRAAREHRRFVNYISGSQYEAWKHTDIVIDVVPGRGGMFSLDNGREKRFLVRSEMCAIPAPAKA
jgi:hypothetical protein